MTKDSIFVVKRDGVREPFSPDKIHKVLEWAVDGVTGVSVSEIELRANLQLYDGIKSTDIHQLMIKSAAELINESTPNYQWVAARLISYKLRKEVYGGHTPWKLSTIVGVNIAAGVYNPEILEYYSEDELDHIDGFIKHDRDDDIAYAGMEQMQGKYLVQDRSTGQIYETPQIVYIMVAATLFMKEPKEKRMALIRQYYENTSQFQISLPTPIMAGVRTPSKQFSSCVLIECDDSLDSITGATTSIITYVAKKAGIGIGAGAIRGAGSKVGAGQVRHTGVTPFFRLFQNAIKSCSQGGVRGGAGTVHTMIWHQEIKDILVLKNNKGTEETRVRQVDYSIQINKLFYERLLADADITLFSPHDVPGLYDAFFAEDQSLFRNLYTKYEKMRSIPKTVVKAADLFGSLVRERRETGRIYIMNVDNVNEQGMFHEPVRMSNLCQEIALPTSPVSTAHPENGEIALCTLSAQNFGLLDKPSDLEAPCRLAVRALDNLLDYQEYPLVAARNSVEKHRPLGVGVINLAYFLAKRGLKYNLDACPEVHRYAEAMAFYLIKASVDLAEERGPAAPSHYSDGQFPHERSRKCIIDVPLEMDWEGLRPRMIKYGIRNNALMAGMPAETSAQIPGATNGMEPIPALVTYKQSKDGKLAQVAPAILHTKNKYDMKWEQQTPEGYLQIMSIFSRFFDQSISVNTSYNPANFPNGEIPESQVVRDILTGYKMGLKNYYYDNTYVESGDGQSVEDEADCDSCSI